MKQPLPPQNDFDGIPDSRAGFVGLAQLRRRRNDEIQLRDQRRAGWTSLQVVLLVHAGGVVDLRQTALQFNAIHTTLSPSLQSKLTATSVPPAAFAPLPRLPLLLAAQDYPAFTALFILSRSRNFIRALCNCDLLLPI